MKNNQTLKYLSLIFMVCGSLFTSSQYAYSQNSQYQQMPVQYQQPSQQYQQVPQQPQVQPQEIYVGQPVGRKVETGRGAAQKYFTGNPSSSQSSSGVSDNMLMLHLGRYFDSQAYSWAPNPAVSGVGQTNLGVTYLFDQWHGMDLNIRVDYFEFDITGTHASKLSFLPLITFPRTETRFPLYFGIGLGPGIFMQQVKNKSNISFDYQLVVGMRFMELLQGVGAFVEFAMKNHLHVLSEGQLNGMTLTFGPIFNF